MGPSPASRAAAIRAAKAATQPNDLHPFPLVHTGGEALVRRLDLQDLIVLDAIPLPLHGAVNAMLDAHLGGSAEAVGPAAVVAALGGPITAMRRSLELADAAALAGFVDPKLVPTAAEITDPEHELALEEIDRADRLAYWEWCQGLEAAAALAPAFPEPQSAPAARPAGESVRESAVELPDRAAAGARR